MVPSTCRTHTKPTTHLRRQSTKAQHNRTLRLVYTDDGDSATHAYGSSAMFSRAAGTSKQAQKKSTIPAWAKARITCFAVIPNLLSHIAALLLLGQLC